MNHKAQGFKINLISDVEMQLNNSFNLRVIKDSSTTLSQVIYLLYHSTENNFDLTMQMNYIISTES